MRVFIAHANDGSAEFIRRFLTNGGCEVETISGGVECLAKLRQSAPDVLILDFDLPWGGGDGVLAWLRENEEAPVVPVVLMTRGPLGPSVTPLLAPPVAFCLRKPFRLDALLRAILSALTRRRPHLVVRSRAARVEVRRNAVAT